MRRWQTTAVIATLVAAGLAVPVAWAATRDDATLPHLPRPTGDGSAASATASASATAVVKLEDGASTTAITSLGAQVLGDVPGTDYVRVRPADGDPDALVASLLEDPRVEEAAPDYTRTVQRTPTDSYYAQYQSGYLSTVRMPEAWDRVSNAGGQVIAVIDTGVDASHRDLAGRVLPGYNAVNPGANTADTDGHGTFVAGIIAANVDNGPGIAGIAWNAAILPVQVFSNGIAYDSDVAEGIAWAVDHGATVINLSLSGDSYSPILYDAVRYAVDHNVVVVAAAGNTGSGEPQYPAALPDVIAVGATDADGRLTDFSTWGDWLDIAAPGFGITSIYPGNQYRTGDGTSFAAPIVSGVAALVRTQNPWLTAADVAGRLAATARDAGPRGIDPYYGHGVLDAARALGAPAAADLPLHPGPGEPNDVPARATDITVPADGVTLTIDGSFGVEGDADWYHVVRPGGAAVLIDAALAVPRRSNDTSQPDHGRYVDAVIEVFDANLGRIRTLNQWGPGRDEHVNTGYMDGGDYYLRVSNANGAADDAPYHLAVTVAVDPQRFSIEHRYVFFQGSQLIVGELEIGDVTGDGRDDLVGIADFLDGSSGDRLFVMPQLPDGSLGERSSYTGGWGGALGGLALADLDRDGRLDVVTNSNYASGTYGLSWFRQLEDGTLASQGAVPGFSGLLNPVYAADVDGDSAADLFGRLVTNTDPAADRTFVLLTHGAGATVTASSPLGATKVGGDFGTGDLDGDGTTDVALFAGSGVTVLHHAAGQWTTTSHSAVGNSFAVGDLNRDHRDDIVVVNDPSNVYTENVFVLTQNSDGTLAAPATYDGWLAPRSVGIGDLEGNGFAEAAWVANSWNRITTLYLLPTGSSTRNFNLGNAQHTGPQGLTIGDLDGDGLGDIALATGNTVSIARHGGEPQTVNGHEHVWSVSPASGVGGVALDTAAQVVFATDVDPSTVNSEAVRLVDGRTGATVPTSLSYDPATHTATLTPDNPLHKNKPYRIAVDGVTTVAGDPQLRPFSSTFVTVDTGPLPELSVLWMHGIAGTTVRVDQLTVPAGDVAELIIRAAAGGPAPATPTDGTIGYRGVDPNPVLVGFTPATTYFFSLWYRDRAGNLSPRTTAVLRGSTVTMELTSGTSTVTSTDTLRFTTTVTGPADDPNQAMRPITLSALCRGGATTWQPVEQTVIWGQPGTLISAVQTTQTRPDCTYRWEFEVDGFMGAISPTVRVTSTIALPGNPPPRQH